jgi:hypothetical protein
VNTDAKERARSTLQREQMTWPTFWDGGNTSGPIARQWNNRAWPSFHVLDAKGVIRFKGVPGADVDKAVAELLKERGATALK